VPGRIKEKKKKGQKKPNKKKKKAKKKNKISSKSKTHDNNPAPNHKIKNEERNKTLPPKTVNLDST